MSEPTRLTDSGNAKRLVDRNGQELRYCAALGKWLRWNGKRWQHDEDGYIVRCVKKSAAEMFAELANAHEKDRPILYKHALYSESARGIQNAIKLAECELAVNPNDLDADDLAFAVQNGVIDLRTGQLRPHKPEDLITRISPVTFDPSATCPTWLKFMDRGMDSRTRLIEYLQRLCGLCLTAINTVQELFILYGGGANGKSIFVDATSYIIGEFDGIAPDSLLILRRGGSEHPTEIAGLCGKRRIVASETEDGGKLRLQLVKKMTGDEKMTGRFMRQDFFEFVRKFKLLLVTNHRPAISESTEAAWRRIRLIPFTVTIPAAERDPDLLAKLKKEASGILNWMIEGCLDFQKNGMQPPAEVLAATAEYQADADPMADFFDTRCIMGDFARVSRAEVWTAYQSWLKASGERDGMDRSAIYERIRHLDGVEDSVWKSAGATVRGFTGIGLCAHSEAEIEGVIQ